MLRVDLVQLGREGSVLIEARISADDGLWQESDPGWTGDVEVRLSASFAGTGEVIVRGRVSGTLDQQCRRCLRPVATAFEGDLTMVFVSAASDEEVGDDESYALDAGAAELDLGSAVREELILAINPYAVCDPKCQGLCPKCGANLGDEACDCAKDEADPRWEALRALMDR